MLKSPDYSASNVVAVDKGMGWDFALGRNLFQAKDTRPGVMMAGHFYELDGGSDSEATSFSNFT